MTSTNPVLERAPGHRINEGAMDSSLWRTTAIANDLDLASFGLRELDIDTPYAFLDADGSSLCIHRDPVRTAAEIARFCPADGRAYIELANALEAAMNVAVPYMNSNPVRPGVGDILTGAARSARHPSRFEPLTQFMTASQAEFIDTRFSDHRIKSLLAAVPCFAPISDDGTAWVLIYFGLIHRVGVGRFEGGTGAVTDALARCFEAAGGQIRLGAPVDRVIMRAGRAAGVRLESGEEIHARAVVTTNNAKTVLGDWLPDGALPDRLAERVRYIPTASTHASSFKVDVALGGRAELSAHQANRHDDVDLRRPALCFTTFDEHVAAWHDCARGEVPDPLPGFAILPSGMDPTQAPTGQDTFWFWSGISPVNPTHRGRTSPRPPPTKSCNRPASTSTASELAIDHRVMTPVDIAARFRAPDGNVYHVDPVATRFGPLRPAVGLGRIPHPGGRPVPQRRQHPSQRRHLRRTRPAGRRGRPAIPAGPFARAQAMSISTTGTQPPV